MRLRLLELIRVFTDALKKFTSFFIFVIPFSHIKLGFLGLKSFEHHLIFTRNFDELTLANSYIKALLVLFCGWIKDGGLFLLMCLDCSGGRRLHSIVVQTIIRSLLLRVLQNVV